MAKKAKVVQPDGMIEVVVLQGFSAMVNGQIVTCSKGKNVLMPEGADWIKAGLAKPVGTVVSTETATIKTPENAAIKTGSPE